MLKLVANKKFHILYYYVFRTLHLNSLDRPTKAVLTNAQILALFINTNQMTLSATTVTKLAEEGILSPTYLSEFDDKTMSQTADNLRRPGG